MVRASLQLHVQLLREDVCSIAQRLVGAPVKDAFSTDRDGYEQVVITIDDLVVRVEDLFPEEIRSHRDQERLELASFLCDSIYELERCDTLLTTMQPIEVTQLVV